MIESEYGDRFRVLRANLGSSALEVVRQLKLRFGASGAVCGRLLSCNLVQTIQILAMLELLRQIPLFKHLTEDQLKCIPKGTEVWLNSGETLFQQGTPPEYFYILFEGAVRISRKVGNRDLVLATYDTGMFFSEVPLLAGTAGLTPAPSAQVQTPRIAESPVNLECREHTTLESGRTRIVIGEVLHLHIGDEFIEPISFYLHTEQLHVIGRMHGAGWHVRTADLFQLPRLTYEEWHVTTETDSPGTP